MKSPLSHFIQQVICSWLMAVFFVGPQFVSARAWAASQAAATLAPGALSDSGVRAGDVGAVRNDSADFARDLSPAGRSGVRSSVSAFGADTGVVGVGSEYISGTYPGAVLIPVSVLGAVVKPGIHHVPTRTNLLNLITLAGGASAEARLDEVTIKRVTTSDPTREDFKEEIIHIDVERLLETAGNRGPILQQNDIVVIPKRTPFIHENTTQLVGFISGLLGLVVSSIVIIDYNKRK